MRAPGDPRRRQAPRVARGSWRPDGLLEFGVCFDADTAAEIRSMAVARGTTFSEAVRLLCEWGLEAVQGEGGA